MLTLDTQGTADPQVFSVPYNTELVKSCMDTFSAHLLALPCIFTAKVCFESACCQIRNDCNYKFQGDTRLIRSWWIPLFKSLCEQALHNCCPCCISIQFAKRKRCNIAVEPTPAAITNRRMLYMRMNTHPGTATTPRVSVHSHTHAKQSHVHNSTSNPAGVAALAVISHASCG